MLCLEEAELAEGLARLCVLRTEDYQLLKSIKKTQQQKPDRDYLSLLLGEFRKREHWRGEREVELLAQLGAWEYAFYSEGRFKEGAEWREMGQFLPVYLECIRATYHLGPKDLKDSPFAGLASSQYLYSCEADSPLQGVGYADVLKMFSPPAKEESAVHAGVLVDTLYPLHRDLTRVPDMLDEDLPLSTVRSTNTMDDSMSQIREDIVNIHVKPPIRASLRASLKVWQVLFLLWKHLLLRCPVDTLDSSEDIFHVPSTTAGNFLNTQRCRFASLLESIDSMHEDM